MENLSRDFTWGLTSKHSLIHNSALLTFKSLQFVGYIPLDFKRFNIATFSVVCQMLGFDWGLPITSGTYGEGTGDILLDDVQCHGTELNIGHCEFEALHNCEHAEDAAVSCHFNLGELNWTGV